ncbi:MAG: type III-A CRISPR-associated RAMP protein Csm4 [Clostridium sp.]|nr:type III-A CRISPR-associated RAMP protein Csm4 [Clostridium sp.]
MNYIIYRLTFPNGIHLGNKNLEESNFTFFADTLFSALFKELLNFGNETYAKHFYECVKNGDLIFSDGLPFMEDTYYIPKPMLKISSFENLKIRKAYKKLKYIPIDLLDDYLEGELDIVEEENIFEEFGVSSSKTSVAIRGQDENKPYRVGIYNFREKNGIYILVGYNKKENIDYFNDVLHSLSYSGLGGKRSSGLGRFTIEKVEDLPDEFKERLNVEGNTFMTLSVSLPEEKELESVLEGARYNLIKRSGFVSSTNYSNEFQRKKDFYLFEAGSCFKKMFKGNIYDVSAYGTHPVYRYAKGLFLEVSKK